MNSKSLTTCFAKHHLSISTWRETHLPSPNQLIPKSYFFPYSDILNLAERRAEFLHPAGPYRQRRQERGEKREQVCLPAPSCPIWACSHWQSLLADEFSSSTPMIQLISPENYNNGITVCLPDAENLWLDSKLGASQRWKIFKLSRGLNRSKMPGSSHINN